MCPKKKEDTWAIIMMAGMGTRMKSDVPKVLHEVCGLKMGEWVLNACTAAGVKNRVVVVGHHAEEVMAAFQGETFALQHPQKGTGHAVMVGLEKVPQSASTVLILSGDVPCLKPATISRLLKAHKKFQCEALVLSFFPPDPGGYGRIIRDNDGRFTSIVEDKDLKGDLRDTCECNSGIYVFERSALADSLKKVKPSKRSGEYHLPDALQHIMRAGGKVEVVWIEDWMEAAGVNNRAELAEVGHYLRWQIAESHMMKGVTIVDPAATWIGPKVTLGRDCIIMPGSIIMGSTKVGEGSTIGPNSQLENVQVGKKCKIVYSVLENCRVDDGVSIGPFAHIRPGTRIRKGAKVGNFVEMKNTDFGEGSKSGHLTYLGDAIVGNKVNIGAGTITCNFDGEKKNVTVIEDDVFVGSDSILVAPITIGKGAYTAAGSTLTQNVPPGALAVGRAKQVVKEGWVERKKQSNKK